jgi:3-oxoacyl-[acyl-carrier protein] reductase
LTIYDTNLKLSKILKQRWGKIMKIELNGKTALVCGSSQGLGKAIALQFSKLGASVVLMARNEELLKKTLQELKRYNGQEHTFIQADFDNPGKVIAKLDDYLTANNTIHILVNNSGGPEPNTILNSEIKAFEDAFRQHIVMSQLLSQRLIPGMKKANFGRIINIISISVKQPIDNLGVSNTIRGAMASWAKTLSKEVAPFGITVNNILPGYTLTSRLESLFDRTAKSLGISIDEAANNVKTLIPAGRFAEPKELGYLAGFLASDYASYINGTNIPVDGGFLNCL